MILGGFLGKIKCLDHVELLDIISFYVIIKAYKDTTGEYNMSYDVSIGDAEFNYTFNLADFFHDYICDQTKESLPTGLQALNNLPGLEAAKLIKTSMEEINLCGDKLHEKYNPSNGWGDVTRATVFLARIMSACYENPTDTVSVWT